MAHFGGTGSNFTKTYLFLCSTYYIFRKFDFFQNFLVYLQKTFQYGFLPIKIDRNLPPKVCYNFLPIKILPTNSVNNVSFNLSGYTKTMKNAVYSGGRLRFYGKSKILNISKITASIKTNNIPLESP